MDISLDPVKPYANAARAVAIAVAAIVVVSVLTAGGCAMGKRSGEKAAREQIDELGKQIARKDTALLNASASLRGAAAALREVNEEAARRQREAKAAKAAADKAGVAAANAKRDADRRMAEFDRELERARKRAVCESVFNFDIRKECTL